MRALLIAVLASALFMPACGPAADNPTTLTSPASPSGVMSSGVQTAKAPAAKDVEVPFHSEVTWTKVVNGGDASPCLALHGAPPAGTSYLMRNTNEGAAVSNHLGAGYYVNHTCVYGTTAPMGWRADVRWTAANGDELLATSEFVKWVVTPEARVAIEKVTFVDGGSGRFAFAEGEAECQVNVTGPLARTATYDGALRYGRKDK